MCYLTDVFICRINTALKNVKIARVLSRIFSLGGKIRLEIDGWGGGGGVGGCGHRPEFSRGSGGMPPQKTFVILSLVRVVLRYFKTVLRSW